MTHRARIIVTDPPEQDVTPRPRELVTCRPAVTVTAPGAVTVTKPGTVTVTQLEVKTVTSQPITPVTGLSGETVTSQAPDCHGLILSIFPGIDLLGKAFEEFGFCIVRGPDLIFGGDIRSFHPPKGAFFGLIGGSPCQDFSKKRRCPPTGYGLEMLKEFERVLDEAQPEWFLLENVPGVPNVTAPAQYVTQRFDVDQAWFDTVSGLRHIQFGSLSGKLLDVTGRRCPTTNGRALANDNRPFSDLVRLQGLPEDFNLPSFTLKAKKQAVGNGVPMSIGRALANAVCEAFLGFSLALPVAPVYNENTRRCACGCGRPVYGRATYAKDGSGSTAKCRKRAQRQREQHS